MRFLVRDPELLNKVWSVDVSEDALVEDLIKAFVRKRSGGAVLPAACQLKFGIGQRRLAKQLPLAALLIHNGTIIESGWDASSVRPCPRHCIDCEVLSRGPIGGGGYADPSTPSLANSSPASPNENLSASRRRAPSPEQMSTDHLLLPSLDSTTTPSDLVLRLEQLITMHRDGFLSKPEFDKAKSILFRHFN
eukprot:Protomagalhaensia_wolfi_Nauph_80__2681@NODE_280_length_2939_cov_43_973793_g210_i0_p2_GENE_NODE_280_length_2939_cov_43_973793_g210_i0NODE_280_length_2939_cov_43_973793_g210_i0_p2_ORF_typecomplete_len192_score28_73_NODE_280_length_2939_cov_43_973793_g210_i018122387